MAEALKNGAFAYVIGVVLKQIRSAILSVRCSKQFLHFE
jgi:hypothetical protein